MTDETFADTLAAAGYKLPAAAAPAANYVPRIIDGDTLYIAGQLPFLNGEKMHQGRLGADMDIAAGQEAARCCLLNILAQAHAALDGDMTRIRRCLRLGGFIQATPDFDQHPVVINGASDLLAEVLGERGTHTRFAVGAASLPFGVAVEIDAVFSLNA